MVGAVDPLLGDPVEEEHAALPQRGVGLGHEREQLDGGRLVLVREGAPDRGREAPVDVLEAELLEGLGELLAVVPLDGHQVLDLPLDERRLLEDLRRKAGAVGLGEVARDVGSGVLADVRAGGLLLGLGERGCDGVADGGADLLGELLAVVLHGVIEGGQLDGRWLVAPAALPCAAAGGGLALVLLLGRAQLDVDDGLELVELLLELVLELARALPGGWRGGVGLRGGVVLVGLVLFGIGILASSFHARSRLCWAVGAGVCGGRAGADGHRTCRVRV